MLLADEKRDVVGEAHPQTRAQARRRQVN